MQSFPLPPIDLSPAGLLHAYCNGIFPMASPVTEQVDWYHPEERGVLPLENLRVSRSLRKVVEKGPFEVAFDRDFAQTIATCAELRPNDTWISAEIRGAYVALHEAGFAHSVETWRDGRLVGGLYGVAINGAFFGESMFHTETDASKVALVALVRHMRERGMLLLDTRDATPHLASLGVLSVDRDRYGTLLSDGLLSSASFDSRTRHVSLISGFVEDQTWFLPDVEALKI